MGRITVFSGLSEDRNTAAVEIREDEKPLAHAIFDAAELEGFIRTLAQLRWHMTEEVSPELDPGARVEYVEWPAWRVPDRHTGPSGTTLLALRHPGLGWLGFLFPHEVGRTVAQALIDWSK
jgi:hypothetical protein